MTYLLAYILQSYIHSGVGWIKDSVLAWDSYCRRTLIVSLTSRLLLASLALDQVTPTTSEGWWEEAEDKDLVPASSNTDQQLANGELQELCEHINDRSGS